MTAKVTCGMFQMFLRPAQRRACLADLPMRFRRICLSAWPECWPCLARPAPLRGRKREDQGCQSRQTYDSCAHKLPLSSESRLGPGSLHLARLENSEGAYEKEPRWQPGNPERKDLTLRLWTEMIGQERGSQ